MENGINNVEEETRKIKPVPRGTHSKWIDPSVYGTGSYLKRVSSGD